VVRRKGERGGRRQSEVAARWEVSVAVGFAVSRARGVK
jgi:hypothetical protein